MDVVSIGPYTRGLIALFQSREQALASFQQVRSVAPNSRFATLSTCWIDLQQVSGSAPSFLDVQSAGGRKVTEDVSGRPSGASSMLPLRVCGVDSMTEPHESVDWRTDGPSLLWSRRLLKKQRHRVSSITSCHAEQGVLHPLSLCGVGRISRPSTKQAIAIPITHNVRGRRI